MSTAAAPLLRFKNATVDEIESALAPLGVNAKIARRLQAAVCRKGHAEIPLDIPEVSPKLLQRVREVTDVPRLTLIDKVVSPTDGFAKYLFRGEGEQPFETVRIPLLHREGDQKYVLCVSSQVGCAMACAFCATGKLGFQRNLATWEIIDQVLQVQADSEHPVRGIVFMGMGEPMLNYDRVMRAARILSEPSGLAIDGKAITISTVGIVPMIRRFTREKRPYKLVVSLTSADPETRKTLLPIENKYSTANLLDAVREYHAVTGKRVTFAWTLISGVNTREEDARRLAELTRDLPIILDIIDVNDPTGEFRRPDEAELNRFRDALNEHLKQPVVRRYSGGQDIGGGCGMLAGQQSDVGRQTPDVGETRA